MSWVVGLIIGLFGGFVGGVGTCAAFISSLAWREKMANRK